MAGNLIELTDADFDSTVNNSEGPVLVDFWAPWCGPCKMIGPVIQEIADEYAGKSIPMNIVRLRLSTLSMQFRRLSCLTMGRSQRNGRD